MPDEWRRSDLQRKATPTYETTGGHRAVNEWYLASPVESGGLPAVTGR